MADDGAEAIFACKELAHVSARSTDVTAAAGRGDCARGLPLGLLTTRRGDDGTAFCFRLRAEFGGCVTKCCIVLAERERGECSSRAAPRRC